MDFSKTFDLVSNEILLEMLSALGFDGCLKSCEKGLLQGRLMSVSVAGKLGQEVEISSRIPQGSVLEPLPFLLSIE